MLAKYLVIGFFQHSMLFIKRLVLCLGGLTCLSVSAYAQIEEEEEDYTTQIAYGINLNTNAGLIGGPMFRYSRKMTNNMYHYLNLEIVNVKHPKEYRLSNPNGGSVTLLKQNYFFVVRPQYGREVVLFRKAPEQGVQINGILAAGPSIGLLKPYYIQYYPNKTSPYTISAPYNSSIMPGDVASSGNFFDGFDQLKFKIGASVKAAASFELGTFRNSVTGFEIGLLLEAFTDKIIIMDPFYVPGQRVFTSAYVNIFFGGRR